MADTMITVKWAEMTRYRLAAENLGLDYTYYPDGPGAFGIRVSVPEEKKQDWVVEVRRPDLLDGMRAP